MLFVFLEVVTAPRRNHERCKPCGGARESCAGVSARRREGLFVPEDVGPRARARRCGPEVRVHDR